MTELGRPRQNIAISVCDITSAQPREATLRALFEEMPGINPDDVTLLIATGTQRTNTRAELERMLGHDIAAQYTLNNHHSRDEGPLPYLGRPRTAAPLPQNKR